ncbi:MAG: hypothetical protein ACYSW8_32245 [Planctomycetota bacterium]|jgi:hypothetical protein
MNDEIERLKAELFTMRNVFHQQDAEIKRLQKAYRPADMIEYQELVAENERLRHEIDVQCSSEYVERILKETERLKAELFTMRNVFHQQDECIEEQEEMLEELQAEVEHLRAVLSLRKLQDAEIKRLRADNELLSKHNQEYGTEIGRLRAALAKSCEEGRDEMYDCGYNRLRKALERTMAEFPYEEGAEIAREALR